MSVREPIAILISDIDPSKITLSVPKKGQGSAKPETYVSYDGRPLAIQFGTATEPLKCPYGLERWVQSKPERVKSSNPDWAVNDNTLFNKVRTAKLSGNLRLNNHADANSADAKAVEKMNAIVYRIVECFVSGVQDENGKQVKLWDANLPAEVVRRMITTPLREATEEYPPFIKFKTRFRVVDSAGKTLNVADPINNAERLKIDCDIYDGQQESTKTPIADPLDSMFSGATTGIWLFKVNPILIGKSSANVTFELTRAKIVRIADFYKDAGFANDGAISAGGEEAAAGVGGFGTTTTTTCAEETANEPLAKRIKVDASSGSASPAAIVN